MSKTHYIIPVFVPHKGCPFDCVFCNQKKITGLTGEITPREVDEQIKEYIKTIEDIEKKQVEIAFFGGSFTGIDIEKQEELLKIAYKWKGTGLVKDIRISTRPDYINHSIMDFLVKYGVTVVELGVQSMKEDVLFNSGRGHTAEDVVKAVNVMRQYGVKIGLQMMIGLPGDTLEKAENTAQKMIDLSPDFVRIYPTLVVKDTYLEKMYLENTYKPLTIDEAVCQGKNLLLRFIKNNIPVIRIGLQPTENILMGKEVIAGPFHSSFRQLVEGEIFKDMLDYLLTKENIRKEQCMEIQVNDQYVSCVAGQKKRNTSYIRDKFNISKIRIRVNNGLHDGNIKIFIPSQDEIIYNMKKYADNAI